MAGNGSRIITLKSGHHVWTRRVGDSPDGRPPVLLLHGGPGCTHECFECFESHLPQAGYTFYYYDQLGSYFSDQPEDRSLWNVERFREEVEEVRQALGLANFYLYGQSWGGMLAMEYALKYQDRLKAVVISNMTASIPSYVKHINELRERMPADVVAMMRRCEAEERFDDPEYQKNLTELYNRHLCRVVPWPEPLARMFTHMADAVYNTMQGNNEFVVTGNFAKWDRWADIHQIRVPALLLVGRHDTMRVSDIEEMGRRIPRARVAVCESGSHCAMWDDEEAYFAHLLAFLRDVAGGALA